MTAQRIRDFVVDYAHGVATLDDKDLENAPGLPLVVYRGGEFHLLKSGSDIAEYRRKYHPSIENGHVHGVVHTITQSEVTAAGVETHVVVTTLRDRNDACINRITARYYASATNTGNRVEMIECLDTVGWTDIPEAAVCDRPRLLA